MISNHRQFLEAIRDKKLLRVVFYSQADGGTIDRECAALDYGPPPNMPEELNRYWIWDLLNTRGPNPLGLLPGQILAVHVLGKDFEPGTLPLGDRTWCVPRNW